MQVRDLIFNVLLNTSKLYKIKSIILLSSLQLFVGSNISVSIKALASVWTEVLIKTVVEAATDLLGKVPNVLTSLYFIIYFFKFTFSISNESVKNTKINQSWEKTINIY